MEIGVRDFDLDQIAASGQCFSWRGPVNGRYSISAHGKTVEAAQSGETLFLTCSPGEFDAVWRAYFDLDADYGAVKAKIDPADPCLTAAAAKGGGIRILRQDLWEVMAGFLISQNNNIGRIRRSVRGLSDAYGAGGGFPRPDDLLGAAEVDFQALGLGYRAKYLVELVKTLSNGGLEALAEELALCDDKAAEARLTALYGVGKKVADCILLFGLHRLDLFPLDTHIKQILARCYPGGFPYERYRGALGIVQQYLFYYDLTV